MIERKGLQAVFLFLTLVVLVVCAVAGKDGDLGWHDQRAFAGSGLRLPAPASAAVLIAGGSETPLELDPGGEWARLPGPARGTALVRVQPKQHPDRPVYIRLSIIERGYGLAAGGAGLVLFLLLFRRLCAPATGGAAPGAGGDPGPLALALSEPGGGLSFARVQLLIWFVPALGIFSALSVPLLRLPAIEPSLAVLFGLSGLTTVLGAAASPPQSGAVVPAPELRQVVQCWNDKVDFSRVQCLVLTIVGALVLIGAFAATMRAPEIPEGFLALLGVSQAAYLGTKVVTAKPGDGAQAGSGQSGQG